MLEVCIFNSDYCTVHTGRSSLNVLYVVSILLASNTETRVASLFDILGLHSPQSSTFFDIQRLILPILEPLAKKSSQRVLSDLCNVAQAADATSIDLSFDGTWAHR